MKNFESSSLNIKQLFDDIEQTYEVPLLQRNYVWQKEEIWDLLKDIKDEYVTDPESIYFLGEMVLSASGESSKSGKRLVVIDGQQRMVTLTIFIATVRDYVKKQNVNQGDVNSLEDYFNGYIGRKAQNPQGKLEFTYFVNLQGKEDRTFKNLLHNQNPKVTVDFTVSERNLIKAKEICNSFIEAEIEDIEKYMYYLMQRTYVVRTITDSQASAYKIFETLNNRGSKLEPEDLLKNLLLQSIKDENKYTSFVKTWSNSMEQMMHEGRYVVKVSTFLKHFIMSKGSYVAKDGIYDWFKDSNKKISENDVFDFLEELHSASKYYREITDGKVNSSLGVMKKLSFTQSKVILLGCLEMKPSDREKASSILEKIAFVYSITGAKTNELENRFCDLAKIARDSSRDPNKLEQFFSELNDILLNKKIDLRHSLKEFRYDRPSQKNKIEYLLTKLASGLDSGNYSDYTIEHILPEKKTAAWNHIPEKQYTDLLTQIGNLTLVPSSDNSALSNKSFEEKVKIYINQSPRLTSSIGKEIKTKTKNTKYDKAIKAFNYSLPQKWNQEEIEKRTDCMIDLLEYLFYDAA